MTLLQAEMEGLAEVLQESGRDIAVVTYDEHRFSAHYWSQPRVFEKLAGTLLRQTGHEKFVFGARTVMQEDERGAMVRPPMEQATGDEFEALWLLGVDLTEGVEIGVVRRTPNGWGALRICADQLQLTPGAPGYWLMQELLREES